MESRLRQVWAAPKLVAMDARLDPTAAMRGCYVISLRPVGGHAAMRRAAARHGARVLALSPWRLVPRADRAAARQLQAALAAPLTLFTSPAAVGAAAALAPPAQLAQATCLAVGAGTAAALHRHGARHVQAPARMDSEGLLALPALDQVAGMAIGLVTAPGGRGQIPAVLQARGATVVRADVYDRAPCTPPVAQVRRLDTLPAPVWLAVSSGQALHGLLQALPPETGTRLRHQARVVVASARLAALVRETGFTGPVVQAADARPASLLAAAAQATRHATTAPAT